MAINSSNFGELLWPGIKELWGASYKEWDPMWTKWMTRVTSDKALERYQGMTGFGLAGVKSQGTNVPYADAYQGYQVQITNIVYALGATITKELYDDDQYNFIKKIPTFLARSLRQTEEVIAHNVLNNGFSAQSNSPDGAALFSTTHTIVDGSTSYANTPTVAADLTQTSLENAEISIMNLIDDRGLKMWLNGEKLIVRPELMFQAKKILETTYEMDSANNTVNPMKGAYELIVSPYLTDNDAWFLTTDIERSGADEGFLFQSREDAQVDKQGEFDTFNMKFITYSRFGVGYVNPRCAYGSPGA